MMNTYDDKEIFRLLFEKFHERIALIKFFSSGGNVEIVEIFPNQALRKLLIINKTQAEKHDLSLFLGLFDKNVLHEIEQHCRESLNGIDIEEKFTSLDRNRIFCLRFSSLNENYITILVQEVSYTDAEGANKKVSADFLADVSHEIRTPLNSIIGFTGMLLDSLQNEEDRKLIKTIESSGKQLLHLINDLTDLSRLEAGELIVQKDTLNLGVFMQNIKDQFEGYRIKENILNVDFELKMESGLKNRKIITDEHRLFQIISNLLSNSFKYTAEGKVVFGVNEKGGKLEFFVKDTGMGIKREDQKLIFEGFKQTGDLSRGRMKGSGLGLSVSHRLVELLGGKMWLDSDSESGSNFHFAIPVEEPSEESEDHNLYPEPEKQAVPDLRGKQILIAEDDPYSLEMLLFLVRATGAEIDYAEDGDKAIELFENNHYDLSLLDIRLPGKTGYEVVQAMKAKNPGIITIAQTAYALNENIRNFKEKGFDEYLTKPINPDLLYRTLRKHLL